LVINLKKIRNATKSNLLKDGEIVNQKPVTIANSAQPLGTHVLVLKTLEGKHPT